MKTGNHNQILEMQVGSFEDIILAREKVRLTCKDLGFNLLDITRVVTAVSELSRNMVVHASGGQMIIGRETPKNGICIIFKDNGPGIADIHKAMQKGYSTSGSMGVGLSGSKNLSDDFHIASIVDSGTTITYKKYLQRRT